jgi:Trk K+ transport system NAD-binding subunit
MTERFLVAGLSRVGLRIIADLAAAGHHIDVLCDDAPLLRRLDRLAAVAVRPRSFDLDADLVALGAGGVAAIFAVDKDEVTNLAVTRAAGRLAPGVAVIAQATDPLLFERLAGPALRRVYSVPRLAAPAIVARALGDEVVETLRLHDREISLLRIRVGPGSPLAGLAPHEVEARFHCAAVARRSDSGGWAPQDVEVAPAGLRAGEELVVGGPTADAVALAAVTPAGPATGTGIGPSRLRAALLGRRHRVVTEPSRTLVGGAALAWAAFTLAVVVDLLGRGAAWDTPAAVMELAIGAIAGQTGNRLLAAAYALASLVLGAVLLAQLTAWFTASRTEQRAARRAARLRGHVVVGGLGSVGARVVEVVRQAGLAVAVVERDPLNGRRAELAALGVAVLTGDVRRRAVLERAGAGRAAAVLSCTGDDIANLAAAVSAADLGCPTVVARVFEDLDVDGVHTVSASRVAARAFLAAATDPRSTRTVQLDGGVVLQALRLALPAAVDAAEVARWRAQGVRVLAARLEPGGVVSADRVPAALPAGTQIVIAGPAAEVAAVAALAT